MKLMNLASGSSGNSTLVGTEHTSVLCDAGISKKRIEEALNTAGYTGEDIEGVLITHEHIDHIRGIGVMARKLGIRIYGTEATLQAMLRDKSLGKIDPELLNPIEPEMPFSIGDLVITAHSISHDAADPVCYSFADDHSKACIVTDLGCFDNDLIRQLQGCSYILAEANHDVRMLEVGPYPYPLKQRILSDRGHLSNEAGGSLIRELLNENIKEIRLGHLSEENNFPELALETVRQELLGNPYSPDPGYLNIRVAARNEADPLTEI